MHFKLLKRAFSSSSQPNYSFAVVGSGPGGFFTAKQLMKKYGDVQIDFYEKLPHPYGLVRTGVAPDHQEVKNVEKDFKQLLEDSRVRFLGNINIGKDLPLEILQKNYSSIILAYGADSENPLGIKNENASGFYSARNLVSWYNGHVLYSSTSEFNRVNFSEISDVVIIGNGNVAVDISRMLSKPINDLKHFDMPESVIEKLSNSKVKNIHIVARRGLQHAAFTVKEMRELSKLEGVKMFVYKDEIENIIDFIEDTTSILPSERRHLTRKIDLVKSFNIIDKNDSINLDLNNRKNIFLRFLLTPQEIMTNSSNQAQGIKFTTKNNNEEILSSQLILKSTGYKGVKIFDNLSFNKTNCTVDNLNGMAYYDQDHLLSDNIFCVGWIKTGAKGVIDSTLRDSHDTAESIHRAISRDQIKEKCPDYKSILEYLKKNNVVTVSYDDWKKIDRYEIEEGRKLNKIREKIVDLNKMLSFVNDKI
jgi:adrenodoxin-NADP+ reductase